MSAHRAVVYDRIGTGYRHGRRQDPRIAAAIWAALGDASPVLNVGAGAGSYEPDDRPVVASEPSAVMLSQHPPGAVLQAQAEALPFADNSFGGAMGVLTVHHWTDRARGLAELRRVSRGPVVLFVRDGEAAPWWWLYHYFPATARLEKNRETRVSDLAAMLGGQIEAISVPIPADCTDGFNAAYWCRPAAYLDPEVWRSMSALALIPDADRADGIRRLAADLDTGEWQLRWAHLLGLADLDLGYRVLVAR